MITIANDNPSWGYSRIRGALDNLDHTVARNTIARILMQHGLEPAPSRGRQLRWQTFLKAHLGATAAIDFFTGEVLTLAGLVTIKASATS